MGSNLTARMTHNRFVVVPMPLFDEELLKILVCPRDKQDLSHQSDWLSCPSGHRYRIVEGIPILLVSEAEQTHYEGSRALAIAEDGDLAKLPEMQASRSETDAFVQETIGATNGGLYQHLVGNLTEYPVPEIRLPAGNGRAFLEIGCNWGRWCLAAAKSGYRPVGIDPSFRGIYSARRVAEQMGIQASYLVADGRYLPFRDDVFDEVFSYSVLQHLSKENASSALAETRRVLREGGHCLVQLPNVFGVRCLYHEVRRGFREARNFEVRYWTVPELRRVFGAILGPASVSVDGFFSLNAQISDLRFFPWHFKLLVLLSHNLQRLSKHVPALTYFADSLYVSATNEKRP